MTATAFPQGRETSRTSNRQPPWVLRRWPTWLALALAALTFGGAAADLAEPVLALPLIYLVVAGIHRRPATWPVAVLTIAAYLGLQLQDAIEPSLVLVAIAVIAFAGGLAFTSGEDRGNLWLQSAGMILFGSLAFVAMNAEPGWVLWIVAGAWLAHGVWDLAHLRADKAVARSYAEWCAVIDILVAVQLVILS